MSRPGDADRYAPEPAERLAAATREFNKAASAFMREPTHYELMRRQLQEFSPIPLMVMISRPFADTLDFLPELVLNLCQGSALTIDLARNLIRTLPKSELERRVVADLESLVDGMAADEVAQLADLLVEFGLSEGVGRVVTYAGAHSDDEMRRLAEDLEGVIDDESRRRLRG